MNLLKYCLNCRQEKEYLNKCDEIKVDFKDIEYIPQLIEEYPQAIIILNVTKKLEDLDINLVQKIEQFSSLYKERFICCLKYIEDAEFFLYKRIKYYYGFPVSTYSDLNSLITLKVCYIKLEAPLFFDLNQIKNITEIPIRATANIAIDNYFPYKNPNHGCWIRPEDINLYENYIETIEFENVDLKKESALFRVYKEEKEWIGFLTFLFENFPNDKACNDLIMPEVAKRRIKCKQKCEIDKVCNLCDIAISLSCERDNLIKLKETMNEEKE